MFLVNVVQKIGESLEIILETILIGGCGSLSMIFQESSEIILETVYFPLKVT